MTENAPPTPEPIGRFLTLADTADVLNVTARQALELIHRGELPAIQVRGRAPWRIERSVLESYIEAKYEESRRMALWNQSAFTELPELSGGRIIKR